MWGKPYARGEVPELRHFGRDTYSGTQGMMQDGALKPHLAVVKDGGISGCFTGSEWSRPKASISNMTLRNLWTG